MNNQAKTWITLSVVAIVSTIIASSVFSVVAAESKDALRALVIATVLVSAVVNGAVLLYKSVIVNNKDTMVRVGGIMCAYIVILMAFVYFDYKVAGSINLDQFDSRLRFVIVNAIWIPATFTALVFFYLYKKARELYKSIPLGLRLLEYVVGAASFVGSSWGTFDAVYLMSHGDWILAGVMAVSVDAMLFIMGTWHLSANDSATANITIFGKAIYFVIALAAQVIDGALRSAGLQTQDYSQLGWTSLPFVIIGSGIFIGITYLIDKSRGGVSFGSHEMPAHQPQIFVEQPARHEMPAPSQQRFGRPPDRPQIPAQAQKHGKPSNFAEPGGLERETVAALKELGYSNRAIAGMRQQEADNRVKNKVPPRPEQRSGNQPNQNASATNERSSLTSERQVPSREPDYVKLNGNGQTGDHSPKA